MSRLPLPREYILASLKYVNERLERLPICSIIRHGDQLKISTKEPRHEYSVNSKKGKGYLPIIAEREKYLQMKASLISRWKSFYDDSIELDAIAINHSVSVPGSSIWDQLVSESNRFENSNNIYHNGIHIRSRGEMTIMEILDQLCLDYVYEPELILDGKRFSPDFVIKVPAFGCCIIVEYLGLLDDYNYLDSTKTKIGQYFKNGFFIGTNLILLCGNKSTTPSFDAIYNSIVSTLANLCTVYVKQKSLDMSLSDCKNDVSNDIWL